MLNYISSHNAILRWEICNKLSLNAPFFFVLKNHHSTTVVRITKANGCISNNTKHSPRMTGSALFGILVYINYLSTFFNVYQAILYYFIPKPSLENSNRSI